MVTIGTNTVPDPSQDNTGKQEESKAPVETPKTVAPLVENLLKNSTHLVSQPSLQVLPKKHGTFNKMAIQLKSKR